MAQTLHLEQRNRMPIERINRNAERQGTATVRVPLCAVNHARLFTCPSLAPLTHTMVFAELTLEQQRRYNQLVGLWQNELICFFEQEIGEPVTKALSSESLPPELAVALRHFQEEERQHTQMFRRLNQLAEPGWYATNDYHILQLPNPVLFLLRWMTARARLFPLLIWLMLLMEERSLMMSKRYAALDESLVDAQFLAVYRAHAEDEIRHVQLDWHLLESFYQARAAWLRRVNAWLLEKVLTGLLLKPKRSNVRLVELLIAEFPELQLLRPRLLQGVAELADNTGYRQMMYSPEATPISRALFERLPEFARLRRRLYAEEIKQTSDCSSAQQQTEACFTSYIPNRLNAVIVVSQLVAIFACFYAAAALVSLWGMALLAAAFALLMVSVYSTIHEAEHGMLFSDARVNVAGGIVMAAFFPVAYHLLRQGHLGHHMRNRSDDEAFDLWFEGESPLWKWTQWIGILTGLFYLIIVLGNVAVFLLPFVFHRRWFAFDRPSTAFMDALNPQYWLVIRLETLGVIALHTLIVWGMQIPLTHYLAIYAAFGALWSGLQYLHHYATERHVTRGARNVWLWWPIDKLWLNHNWHRVHHEHPTISWIHLERLGKEAGDDRTFLLWHYGRMWSGPRRATQSVANRFVGKVIR